ncbi:MAG TPA: hypothetical protein VFK33_13055 [Bacillales bacterium]|nr:hypothetical protein [Bacillales bacterium]
MFIFLMMLVLVVCAIALFVTLSVGKELNASAKKYKEEGNKAHNELKRARAYEHSFANVRLILLIYGAAFLVAILLFAIFVF